MCGIAGIFSASFEPSRMQSSVARMDAALRHRGPDDQGVWSGSQVVLSHRRLSILDLSGAARQPMTTPDKRFTVCFNGEIYNFRELRSELESCGSSFTTTSDTEVLLKLFQRDGEGCVSKLRGMFAFAIWDSASMTGFLARDPLGIKPLYVHQSGGTLVFASELRALCQSSAFTPTLDPIGVRKYFEGGSLPEPLTLVKEARMLEAGTTLTWRSGTIQVRQAWQLFFSAASDCDAVEQTRTAIIDSVSHHLISDVPVGIFLSGGIDSTTVLAAAGIAGHKAISTFCVGTDDEHSDESSPARRTAAHFGADHHELKLDSNTACELFHDFLAHVDQPSVDGLNTFVVCALARRHGIKVVLSGLGGDELFGGYPSFRKIPQLLCLHRWLKRVPGISSMLRYGKPQHRRLADFLSSAGTVEDAFNTMRGIFSKAESAALAEWICGKQHGSDLTSADDHAPSTNLGLQVADHISQLEITRYMRNQLLRDSDVMSMAHGLELRVPLVDRVLYESVAQVPATKRLAVGKRLITEAFPELPDWVVNQNKRGFLFPFPKWLSGDWGAVLDQAGRDAPVSAPNWYQRWCIFILRHTIKTLGLQG